MATHSSMLAWKIPWAEEPGGLQTLGPQRVGNDWATEHIVRKPNEQVQLTGTRCMFLRLGHGRGGREGLLPVWQVFLSPSKAQNQGGATNMRLCSLEKVTRIHQDWTQCKLPDSLDSRPQEERRVFRKRQDRFSTFLVRSVGVSCLFLFIYLFIFIFNFLFYIGVQLVNNVVLVSGVEQSDSVIHVRISTLFKILFPFRLLNNIEQSSLCYVGWLTILWSIFIFYWCVALLWQVLHFFLFLKILWPFTFVLGYIAN